MALRDKLVQRATPYLEPGEQIQAIFLAQSGPSPYWIILSTLIVIFGAGYHTVVVTDRAIVILRNGRLTGTFPQSVHLRGPRNVVLGTPTGIWGKIHLDTRYWVHKRFHKDVQAADAALVAMGGGQPHPAGQQHPPQIAPQQQSGQQQVPPQG